MIRPARPDELPWIVHAWVKSFATSDEALLATPRDETHAHRCPSCGAWRILRAGRNYDEGHTALVNYLLERSTTVVREAEDGLLDGFLVSARTPHGEPVIHYVYVRLSARGRGVARELVSTLGDARRIVYTHRSRALQASRLPEHFVYDRYQRYWSQA